MVDIKKVVVGILLLIVFVILLFSLIGGTAGDLTNAADSVTDANNCSLGASDSPQGLLTYNITDKFCYNASTQAVYLAGQFDLPLNSLFSSGGVLMLIFMVAIFLIAIFTVLKGMKDKKQ